MKETISTDNLILVGRRRKWIPGWVAVRIFMWRMADIWPLCHIWEPAFKVQEKP